MRDRIPVATQQKRVEELAVEVVTAAKEAYNLPQMDKYRRKVIQYQKEAFKLITEYVNPDAGKYAFYIQAKIRDYNNYSMLLGQVKAEMGIQHEEN